MIKIVTDSACDVPEQLTHGYGIIKVPTHIIWDGEQYLDSVTMTADEFYRRLPETTAIPTSSQPSSGEFLAAFEEAASLGATEIVCLTVSGKLSGTFASAGNAAKESKVPVQVVDTRSISMQQGFQVLAAARAVRLGGSVQQVLDAIESVRQKVVFSVGLTSLTNLARSGRLGSAFKLISSIVISVHPLVAVNSETGKIEPAGLARTKKSMLDKVFNYFKQKAGEGEKLHAAVMHGAALEEANYLLERLKQELQPIELILTSTGPVIGSHVGPGAVAIAGYYE
ncbi:MAG: DegV family protein [Anaerolineaceae bacterium]|jgi:DegV family protein with EDD domain|nr:DegV family protein [Anaerolineaceae bacterium]MDD4043270.1 DegV family protein [Anaerolineaceae bacterium]MDD4578345.1 DegV family protein [Anaerolineaceae bacterium]